MESQAAATGGVVSLGDGDLETVVDGRDITLVEFYADWCGTCKQMAPVLDTLARETDAAVVTVDIESNLETAIEFGAQSAPTFVLFADGRAVKQLRGGQTEQTLRELIARYRD